MSEIDQITGRQIAAARTLVGMNQPTLAAKANVSVSTLKRMEASAGVAEGLPNNVAAVRRALEAVDVVFTNGRQPGVKMKIYVDSRQAATLAHGNRKVPCHTVTEAVVAWGHLSQDDQKTATITLADGLSYGADDIELLHRRQSPPA